MRIVYELGGYHIGSEDVMLDRQKNETDESLKMKSNQGACTLVKLPDLMRLDKPSSKGSRRYFKKGHGWPRTHAFEISILLWD
jgi:hypothetical protein